MESKDRIPLVWLYVYMFYIYVCFTVSSPYLFVFGVVRVRGTREQMMLQVDLGSYRARAGIDCEKRVFRVFMFMVFE